MEAAWKKEADKEIKNMLSITIRDRLRSEGIQFPDNMSFLKLKNLLKQEVILPRMKSAHQKLLMDFAASSALQNRSFSSQEHFSALRNSLILRTFLCCLANLASL